MSRSMVLYLVIIINIMALSSSRASKVLHCEALGTVSVLMEDGTRLLLFVKVHYV